MYVHGKYNTDELVESTQHYSLKGKADVVMQNTGQTSVRVGNRILQPKESIRLSGELTILQNEFISIQFIGNGTKQMWVHFIQPNMGRTMSNMSNTERNC